MAEEKIKLQSSDGETLEVAPRVAAMMRIEGFRKGCSATGEVFPVTQVRGEILAMAIKFYDMNARFSDDLAYYPPHEVVRSRELWCKEFVVNVRLNILCDLIAASRALRMERLLDEAFQAVADLVRDKSAGEVHAIFNRPESPNTTRASMAEEKIKLESSDGKTLEVEPRVADTMGIEGFRKDCCAIGKVFPVPQVRGEILAMVIRYHEMDAKFSDDLEYYPRHEVERSRQNWFKEFVNFRGNIVNDLIAASKWLQMERMVDEVLNGWFDMVGAKSAVFTRFSSSSFSSSSSMN